MSMKKKGVYSFMLFGNNTKSIKIEEILDNAEDLLNKGIQLDVKVLNTNGFWGQLCTVLGIPNNKNNRYRLQKIHGCHKYKSKLLPSPLLVEDDKDGQKSPDNPIPELLPSPLLIHDDSSSQEEQKSPDKPIPELLPSPLLIHDDSSSQEEQKSPDKPIPELLPSPLLIHDDSSSQEEQKSPDKPIPELLPSPLLIHDDSSSQEEQKSPDKDTVSYTSAEQEFIKIRVPQKPSYFFIERRDWDIIKRKRNQRGFKGLQWTNVIAKGLHSIYPYCSFAFKRHRLKVLGSKKASPEFWCLGYCRFEDCPVTVTVTVDCEKDLKAKVKFQGEECLHNYTELKRRPVRADERGVIGQQLQKQLPRAMYLQRLSHIDDNIMESGCRDDAPTPQVLKNISWEVRQKSRQHSNELLSLQVMIEKKTNSPDEVLQKVFLHPKGVMLWSKRSIEIFQERCREDIVYLDATGSIKKKEKSSPPFYVYEVVVRNPQKGSSPLPVATYLTCDHTTASVTYFLEAFQTDVARTYGRKGMRVPIMLVCDGSIVLMQAICLSFAKKNLLDTMNHYYNIACGKATKKDFEIPILHRCLSHVMKNAKEMCRKYAPNHYHLSMHVFGLLTTASTLAELDDMVQSAAVVFSSPSSGPNVEKHFNNLQCWLQTKRFHLDETAGYPDVAEDSQEDKVNNLFATHYKEVIAQAPIENSGEPNLYFCKGLVAHIARYLLPYAALWTGILLGDLGRHGTGQEYEDRTKIYNALKSIQRQNITEDNKTQGIMEKSQWDLKHIRFRSSRLTRLDDFVLQYKITHTALLKEYEDTKRVFRKKTFRVNVEKWKERQQTKRGRYTTPIRKAFPFKRATDKADSSETKASLGESQEQSYMQGAEKTTEQLKSSAPQEKKLCLKFPGHFQNLEDQLISLWAKKETEVVVSVLPSQIKGNSFVIHHSELLTLQPHQWVTGEIIEGLLHVYASETGNTAYIMNHYTTGLILYGERGQLARHTLRKVNFDNYRIIVSFVNIGNIHWKLLYINAVNQTVYLVDPAKNASEEAESTVAAKKFSEFLKIRRTCHGKTEWLNIKWKGGLLTHPIQQDGSSCGIVVLKMARAVLKAYPAIPVITFDTSKNKMEKDRKEMGLQILKESVFDSENNCSMCSMAKPPGDGPPLTNWIQCDSCGRWFHEQCLGMKSGELRKARAETWNCCLCMT